MDFHKWFFCFLYFVLALGSTAIATGDVHVSMKLAAYEIFAGQQIEGEINVEHALSDVIDSHSFTMQGEPLPVQFVRQVKASPKSNLLVSIYSFRFSAEKPGLYLLPSVSLKVNGKSYATATLTYTVKAREESVKSLDKMIFQLHPFIDGKLPLYVGQQITVGYKIFFNGNIELTKQNLPLLEAEGFKKIGGDRIGDVTEGPLSAREIRQKIEAVKPGTFTFGPSHLEGYLYSTGEQVKGEVVTAEAAAETIIVLDFPKEQKPPSFNGSLGENIDFTVSLLTQPHMSVGDKCVLSLLFTSSQKLANIKLPDICCQPGFPGFFELDDIPALPVEKNGSLTFSVTLRPLTAHMREVPSIEFAYFNPEKKMYELRKSKEIPIQLIPLPNRQLKISSETSLEREKIVWPPATSVAPAIEIHTIYVLNRGDLSNTWCGTWAVLLVVPLSVGCLYIQTEWREKLRRKAEKEKMGSAYKLQLAKAAKDHLPEFCHLLHQALFQRLQEQGRIDEKLFSSEQLPNEGVCQKVKQFLSEIEERRFTNKPLPPADQLLAEAEELFREIDRK